MERQTCAGVNPLSHADYGATVGSQTLIPPSTVGGSGTNPVSSDHRAALSLAQQQQLQIQQRLAERRPQQPNVQQPAIGGTTSSGPQAQQQFSKEQGGGSRNNELGQAGPGSIRNSFLPHPNVSSGCEAHVAKSSSTLRSDAAVLFQQQILEQQHSHQHLQCLRKEPILVTGVAAEPSHDLPPGVVPLQMNQEDRVLMWPNSQGTMPVSIDVAVTKNNRRVGYKGTGEIVEDIGEGDSGIASDSPAGSSGSAYRQPNGIVVGEMVDRSVSITRGVGSDAVSSGKKRSGESETISGGFMQDESLVDSGATAPLSGKDGFSADGEESAKTYGRRSCSLTARNDASHYSSASGSSARGRGGKARYGATKRRGEGVVKRAHCPPALPIPAQQVENPYPSLSNGSAPPGYNHGSLQVARNDPALTTQPVGLLASSSYKIDSGNQDLVVKGGSALYHQYSHEVRNGSGPMHAWPSSPLNGGGADMLARNNPAGVGCDAITAGKTGGLASRIGNVAVAGMPVVDGYAPYGDTVQEYLGSGNVDHFGTILDMNGGNHMGANGLVLEAQSFVDDPGLLGDDVPTHTPGSEFATQD